LIACAAAWLDTPDSIGFGGVFPYMGLAIPSHAREASRVPILDQCSQFF
jgi:hypothetical protein